MEPTPVRYVTLQDLPDWIELFRSEDYFFRLLMMYLAPECMERLNDNYDLSCEYHKYPRTHKDIFTTEELENKLRTHPILVEFFPDTLATCNLRELLQPVRKYLLDNYTVYADIYGIDMNGEEWNDRKAIVLVERGKYLGHIYCYNTIVPIEGGSYTEFIGIRESWRCTFGKLYTHERRYKGIAFSLLDGV